MVIVHEKVIRAENIEKSFATDSLKGLWSTIKSYSRKPAKIPISVDGWTSRNEIAEHFADKFRVLYNSVGYTNDDIRKLKQLLDHKISTVCDCGHCSYSNNHCICTNDVVKAIKELKRNKIDGEGKLMSDHVLNGSNKLNVFIGFLFTALLRHGYSPDGAITGTMLPLIKGRWSNSSLSDNYRAITLSSIFSKMIDIIILHKFEGELQTSDLQFSFKKESSTSLCTCIVQETVSYFVNNKTNVYGLLLDASKAFDRVNFIKLFYILISRNICPMVCRLLLYMYVNQKLRVRWVDTLSEAFGVKNGVKQGGVISPIFYCVYIDGLLLELQRSHVGCYVGQVFSGAYAYADDLTLLAPSLSALKEMVSICSKYAADFDISFNAKKSQLIIFKCSNKPVCDPAIIINGEPVKRVYSVVHLGHILNENINKSDNSKCIGDFNFQCNLFLANYAHASSKLRNILFNKYCTSFYGSQILPIYDDSLADLFRSWRVAVRRVWRVPWHTHSSLLPHLAGVMAPNLWFDKRAVKFAMLGLNSSNYNVKTILSMGVWGSYSVFGGNVRSLQFRYGLDIKEPGRKWLLQAESNDDARKADQIIELCNMRDHKLYDFFTEGECKMLINFLCTE